MRKLLCLLAAFGLIVGAATASNGAALGSASLGLVLGPFPPAVFPGSGVVGNATSSTSFTVQSGTGFNGSTFLSVTDPAAAPVTGVQFVITGNDQMNFAGGFAPNPGPNGGFIPGGGVGATAAINGVANVWGLGAILVPVPVNVGTPATITTAVPGLAVTAIGTGWTTGTASITLFPVVNMTTMMTVVPAFVTFSMMMTSTTTPISTLMGVNGLTPSGQGTVVLVSPIKTLTSLAGSEVIPLFTTLTLTYVPEPGTLLLFGSGVVGLALLGRRKARK